MAQDYTKLITSQHRDKPNFLAVVEATAGELGRLADASAGLTTAFDIDVAVGVQLDKIGQWVGISRVIRVPITGAFFSFDTADLGWDQANWKAPYEATEGITTLDDETYRAVLRAKVGANYWNGTAEQLDQIAQSSFSALGVTCYVIDNQDMSITIYILGTPTAAIIELIKRGVAPPKPAGVRVAGYILGSVSGAPFFALDAETGPLLAGLDFGSFI